MHDKQARLLLRIGATGSAVVTGYLYATAQFDYAYWWAMITGVWLGNLLVLRDHDKVCQC